MILAWSIAAIASVALLAVLVGRRREIRRDTAAAGSATESDETVDLAFDRLPLAALRIGEGGVLAATRRARRDFPFLARGQSLLQTFGEAELARRAAVALASGEPDEFEVRLYVDGRRTFLVSVEPFAVDDGREAIVALLDSTEAIAYQELRMQFVANVSHELRTPLTGIGGLLEALEDDEIDDGVRKRFASKARREVLRLGALVEDILLLSELESGQGLPIADPSDLSAAAADALASLSDAAGEAEITLESDLAPAATVPLTEAMSRQLVANLVGNAIRYAGSGSRARVVVSIADSRVVLEVSDDGAGIPENDLPHIFERFYRADPARSKAAGGTGLGLSIVKHMVERHGGEVTAASREGFGTTIRVGLPRARAEGTADAPVAAV